MDDQKPKEKVIPVHTNQFPRELLEQAYREIQAKKADPNYKPAKPKKGA